MKPLAILFAGQGTQKPEMFKELANSENRNLAKAAEEVLDVFKSLGTDASDIFDIYYNNGVDPVKISHTRNVQPGLAAYLTTLYMALENELGHKLVPYVASGRSFGVIPSLYALGVLSLEDMLNVALMRGESMSLIKPGQYSVMTMKTDEPVRISWMNWKVLRRTGYRVCIIDSEDIISISGPLEAKDKVEERLESYGVVATRIPIKDDVFYAPFHNGPEMGPYSGVFKHGLIRYCRRREMGTDEKVFKDTNDGFFVTNGNRVRISTDGKWIMDYISSDHIVQLCDFRRTMQKTGELADDCIGIGQMNFQKRCSDVNGYIKDFFVLQNPSKLTEALHFYETIPERELEPTPIPDRTLAQPYQTA